MKGLGTEGVGEETGEDALTNELKGGKGTDLQNHSIGNAKIS